MSQVYSLMKVILVCVGNFQEYILDNIKNLKLFGNEDITVITDRRFFDKFSGVDLVDAETLNDFGYSLNSRLDREFRNGFWYLCSLRFFYIYSYMKNNSLTDCIHLENDVMAYLNFDELRPKLEKKVHVAYDQEARVSPSIMYIPDAESFWPIINEYDTNLDDMANIGRMNLEPFPIYPDVVKHKITKNYKQFGIVFDSVALGIYLGGVDPRNDPSHLRPHIPASNMKSYLETGDSRGFACQECIVRYDAFTYQWIKKGGLYVPHMIGHGVTAPIANLHIHSKRLQNFMADDPKETLFIPVQNIQ